VRILLFTSQMNSVIYGQTFGTINHQFTIVTLVPKLKKNQYAAVQSRFDNTASNVVNAPIYLESPNEKSINPIAIAKDFRKIYATLRVNRPDAVIGMFVVHAYPLVLLKRVLKFSLFTLVSGSDIATHQGVIWRLIRRTVFRSSLVVFTVAKRFSAQIERESGRKAIVIPTGTNPDYYKPLYDKDGIRRKYGFDICDFIVLSLSSLVELKCVDDIIKAVEIVNTKHPHTKLIIAGEGPLRPELEKLSAKLNVECLFTGYIGESIKRELYNIANVYVLASSSEGMPFSVMEAMSCGCVCICTDVGGLSEIINDSINGYLTQPHEPHLMANKIGDIMTLSELQLHLINDKARQTILHNYDFRKLTEKMVSIIMQKSSREFLTGT